MAFFEKKFIGVEVICDTCHVEKKKYFNMFRNGTIICCCYYDEEKYEHKCDSNGKPVCCNVCINIHFVPTQTNFSTYFVCKECNNCVDIIYFGSTYSSLQELHEKTIGKKYRHGVFYLVRRNKTSRNEETSLENEDKRAENTL